MIASHCHWDHIGSLVVGSDEDLRPLFPNAIHYMPEVEVEMLKHADHARRASYRLEDLLPIEEAGLLETFEGETELLDGVVAEVVGGHSDGVSIITVNRTGEGATAAFWADVVPTTHHIQPPYIMAYDIDVVRSFNQRSALLELAANEGWIGLFYHDADEAFGRVSRAGKRYEFLPLTEDEAPARV